MASERSIDHPVLRLRPPSTPFLRPLWAPSVGRKGGLWRHPVGAGGGSGARSPRRGTRMAHATAVPIAGRGSDSRFLEASHKRHLTAPTGFSASQPLRVEFIVWCDPNSGWVPPAAPGIVTVNPRRTGNRDIPPRAKMAPHARELPNENRKVGYAA